MREISFRAKRTDNGEWVEGAYVHYDDIKDNHKDDCDYIVEMHTGAYFPFCKVIPETVGQYTGLTDKNGRRIFEGDVVKFDNVLYHIVFETGCFRICKNNQISYTLHNLHSSLEIIGNIYDNPELTKGAGQ